MSSSDSSTPNNYRAVGIVLAVGSGILIGSSFVLKKKGLQASQATAGHGVAYLKNPLWWTGMIMMICGELCNFGAYAFVEAILVTPLGALSVVICAILSHFFLKEKLTLFGWIGCFQCIVGSVIIAMNAPEEQSVSTIEAFKSLFLAPWFLAYGSLVIVIALVIIFYFAPRYGERSMLWYITVCSVIGGLSVACTQGLGACILTSIRGDDQFKNWFIYFLLVFVICTLLTEVYFLNVALALFNTAMVTPTYYVLFTFCTLVTSVILYEGLKASAVQILTIVFAFFQICAGIFILQMSKVDPQKLQVDGQTSLLLQAAREHVGPITSETDPEKAIELTEEPGMDALRGTFGAIGTLRRARRRSTFKVPLAVAGTPTPGSPANGRAGLRELARARSTGTPSVFAESVHSGNGEEPTMSRLLATTEGTEHPGALRRATSSVRFDDRTHPSRISEEASEGQSRPGIISRSSSGNPAQVTASPMSVSPPVTPGTSPDGAVSPLKTLTNKSSQ